MGERSCLLYNIEKVLRLRGIEVELRSIGELKSIFKGLTGPFRSNERLLALLKEVRVVSGADLRLWMTAPTKPLRNTRRKSWETKCKLTRSEILACRASGMKAIDIAHESGVRVSRIYQIINEVKKDD